MGAAAYARPKANLGRSLPLLKYKFQLMALVETIFKRPADDRGVAFTDIATALHISVDEVS